MGAQVTGVFALISVAGLMSVSFERLVDAERGFDEAHLIALVEPEPLERRYATAMARDALWRRVRERLAAVHGVTGAALVAPMPFGGSERTTTILPPGNRDPITFGVTEISSGALDILGVQLTLGREFSIAEEGPGTAVAVVSESFARQLRPDGRVLGITIPLGGATSGNVVQIVGVASDVRQSDLRSAVLPRVWIPYTRIPGDDISVIVRADEPERLAPALHGAVADVDPTLAAERLAPMSVLVRGSAAFDRFRALALAILALAGALMAAIGMYGVTSYAVAERRLELSIRNALGAPADRLLREALGAQLRVVAIGLTAGFPAAVVAGQLLQAFLHQVTPLDASVHVITALAILGLTAAATLMPGLRALRADPSVALREQ